MGVQGLSSPGHVCKQNPGKEFAADTCGLVHRGSGAPVLEILKPGARQRPDPPSMESLVLFHGAMCWEWCASWSITHVLLCLWKIEQPISGDKCFKVTASLCKYSLLLQLLTASPGPCPPCPCHRKPGSPSQIVLLVWSMIW